MLQLSWMIFTDLTLLGVTAYTNHEPNHELLDNCFRFSLILLKTQA